MSQREQERFYESRVHAKPLAEPLVIAGQRILAISDHEHRAIVSALRRLRASIQGQQRRDERAGWKPAEGKRDVQALRLHTVDKLLAKIEHT